MDEMQKLFDPETGYLLLDEQVAKRDSFRMVMQDGIVTQEELLAQTKLVIDYLKKLDEKLDGEEKKLVVEMLCELAVLHEIADLK